MPAVVGEGGPADIPICCRIPGGERGDILLGDGAGVRPTLAGGFHVDVASCGPRPYQVEIGRSRDRGEVARPAWGDAAALAMGVKVVSMRMAPIVSDDVAIVDIGECGARVIAAQHAVDIQLDASGMMELVTEKPAVRCQMRSSPDLRPFGAMCTSLSVGARQVDARAGLRSCVPAMSGWR